MSKLLSDAARRTDKVVIVDPPAMQVTRPRAAIDAVVIAVEDDASCDQAYKILNHWPQVRVLQTQTQGHSSAIYELQPRRLFLGEMAAEEIFAALKDYGPYTWNRWESDVG